MSRWKCICAYDGTIYAGWQTQPSRDAVQDVIEGALKTILKTAIRIHGSGRTDAGVHALGQVFHFDAHWGHGTSSLKAGLTKLMPPDIQISSIEQVDEKFHARYSAQGKCYHYRLFLGKADPFQRHYCLSVPFRLDTDRMTQAGQFLIGQHDFSAFAAENGSDPDQDNPIKDFRRFEVVEDGQQIRLIFEASGFLYKMVRSLTGSLIRVGRGKLGPKEFRNILESGVRTKDVVTAKPHGLFLEEVYYDQ